MAVKESPKGLLLAPTIRMIVSCPRSGSTMLMRIFAESPSCAVTSRLILMGTYNEDSDFSPDYTILTSPEEHKVFQAAAVAGKRFLISKEELGNDRTKGECGYSIFPNVDYYESVKPVFLIRDPIRTFDSWKQVGWCGMDSLVECYENMFSMLAAAKSDQARCLLYEDLIQDPALRIEKICDWWGVPFDEQMLQIKSPLSTFFFGSQRERTIYCQDKPLGLFKRVEASTGVVSDFLSHQKLTNAEKDFIEFRIGKRYIDLWCSMNYKAEDLRRSLKQSPWFGFDLDDTLHEFRKASGAATIATLTRISNAHHIEMSSLNSEYSKILSQGTSGAFSDGKTSHQYRSERFSALLAKFSLTASPEFLTGLLDTYERTLTTTLELKPGVLDLISQLRQMGKKIAVITEGPQDAQERTIKALGLSDKIDFLATTNHFGVAKTDGLFPKVLAHLNIEAKDMVYIGDSQERDMVPAMECGMRTIHFAENQNFDPVAVPAKFNTLTKIAHLVSE